jgi:hypothetical protein
MNDFSRRTEYRQAGAGEFDQLQAGGNFEANISLAMEETFIDQRQTRSSQERFGEGSLGPAGNIDNAITTVRRVEPALLRPVEEDGIMSRRVETVNYASFRQGEKLGVAACEIGRR